jgi:NADH dehydrogenase
LQRAGEDPLTLGPGSVIDQGYSTESGTWAAGASATESTDVVVIRGRALEMLKTTLKLVAR